MVIPYASLIFSRTAIGVYLAGFAAYWVIALNLVWLANYLIHALRMAPQSAAWVIALPSALQMVLAPCCAWLSQGLSARGVPSRISRGLFGALCVMISGISMILVPNVGMANAGVGTLEVLLIGVCFSIGSVIFTLGTTLIGEISPLAQRGAMLGMANSVHTLAGLRAGGDGNAGRHRRRSDRGFSHRLHGGRHPGGDDGFRRGGAHRSAGRSGALSRRRHRRRAMTMQPVHITYLNGPTSNGSLSPTRKSSRPWPGPEAQGRGEVVIEPRVHLVPRDSSLGHFNVLRGVANPLRLAGVKVVGDFVNNHRLGLSSEPALLCLFDPDTGIPRAILDATSLTAMRTGAMTALGGKYLARGGSRVLGHIGARGTAYWNVRLLNHLFDFDEIRVHSRRPESRIAFAHTLSRDLGKPVVAVVDSGSRACGAPTSWWRRRGSPAPTAARYRLDQARGAGVPTAP